MDSDRPDAWQRFNPLAGARAAAPAGSSVTLTGEGIGQSNLLLRGGNCAVAFMWQRGAKSPLWQQSGYGAPASRHHGSAMGDARGFFHSCESRLRGTGVRGKHRIEAERPRIL